MIKFFKHLKIVTTHRWKVLVFSFKVGIPLNGFKHDLSKFSYTEFSRSLKYFQGVSSPILCERMDNDLYSEVAVHHTNRNRHHFEYWIDVYKGQLVIKKMPFKYNLEYCIDMISASMTYMKKDFTKDKVLNYFLERKSNYFMHPGSKEFVIKVLEEYSINGFKNLKKKKLLALYKDIISKYEKDTILIDTNIKDFDYNYAK